MKALVLREYMKLQIEEVPDPVLQKPDEMLVRIHAAAICGSDVHGMDGSTGRRIPPVIMGHEAAGEVLETGPAVRRFRKGDRITFDSTIWCGECFYCRRGEVNLCENRRVLGVSCAEYRQDGAFAPLLVIPERIAYHLPEGMEYDTAALAEPVGVAAHAMRITPFSPGQTAAVTGTGLIGLILLQILRAYSPHLILAFDTDPDRRAAALRVGADLALDPSDPHSLQQVLELTGGRGVDRSFEAVGTGAALKTALSVTRKGGSVTLIGNLSPSVDLPLQSVVTREISLLGSCAIAGEYPLALELLSRRLVDPASVLSATAPLADAPQWFDRLYKREKGLLKVVLHPGEA